MVKAVTGESEAGLLLRNFGKIELLMILLISDHSFLIIAWI